MAARPFRRLILKRVKAMGGWTVVLDRIANGETIGALAKELDCSRNFLGFTMNKDPELRGLLAVAKAEAASAYAEQALEIADTVVPDREEIQKAKLKIDQRRWMAEAYDHQQFGGAEKGGITMNVQTLHLEALQQQKPLPSLPAPKALP